jgi:F0F1-type ATP synthase membrane subunit b/b'|tara:strand:+ start:205 stop:489 length:285 start_codon:yes stop_codon:yes gene_type:complete
MDFYKKVIFVFITFIFFTAVFVKLIEPVFERQISKIFEGKKLSDKIKKELESSTKDFSPEKKEFYKKIVKDTYKKWKPLIDEAINEANSELKNN